MDIKPLTETDSNTLIAVFLKAFKNYYVTLPTNPQYYKDRWKAAKVDFQYSFGMYHSNTLTGFILNAIDHRRGRYTAFNVGTGVIPDYRGKRIVNQLYEHAIPELKKLGIEHCGLEVITENSRAIKAYESIGFKKTRTLKCFGGDLKHAPPEEQLLREIPLDRVDWEKLPNQDLYSWEHQRESIKHSSYRFYELQSGDSNKGYVIMNPETGQIAQLENLEEKQDIWDQLFGGICKLNKTVKINNVDNSLTHKLAALEAAGLQNTIDQFEMDMDI